VPGVGKELGTGIPEGGRRRTPAAPKLLAGWWGVTVRFTHPCPTRRPRRRPRRDNAHGRRDDARDPRRYCTATPGAPAKHPDKQGRCSEQGWGRVKAGQRRRRQAALVLVLVLACLGERTPPGVGRGLITPLSPYSPPSPWGSRKIES